MTGFFRVFLLGFYFYSYLVSCSILRETIPSRPLNDGSISVLLKIDKNAREEFEKVTSWEIPYTFIEKDHSYAVIQREKLKVYGFPKEGINIAKGMPFKYYSGNYQDSLSESIFALADIKKGYKDNILNSHYLFWVHRLFPKHSQYKIIGKSARGREIPAILLTDSNIPDEDKISVLFNCAHHSNEVVSVEHCYDVIYELLAHKKKYNDLFAKLKIWVVPIVNPDGSRVFWHENMSMGRKNGYPGWGQVTEKDNPGVDINRNYPFFWGKTKSNQTSSVSNSVFFRGPYPGSEPETQAMMNLAEKERFAASISYHAFANCILVPYTIDGTSNPEPDLVWNLGKRIASSVESKNPNHNFSAKKNIYGVDGVDQDYYFFKYGTLAYLIESSHLNPPYSDVPKIVESLRPAWTILLEEIADGSKLYFKIKDEQGNPIVANIKYDKILFYHGEIRTSRKEDGMFFQSFPGIRGIKLKVEKEGYETVNWEGTTWRSWKALDIVLRKKTPAQ
ncbi:M14 family zinc carboxypeptidase [Leptospira saintgironsiae]|uniref:Peptidase M14 n=1 Tax=Leptospira saintgironsiae TaxID=2023183 RepID=A0A2M9Y8V3_9LEPT|nr:M14 family zinc carboxypeptidase [Leptospira saintgironsiae]PJZ47991.1 peptidase M14 [Leptospira saintgironsiae]